MEAITDIPQWKPYTQWVLLVLICIFSGCAQQHAAEAKIAFDQRVIECKRLFPDPNKNFAEKANCDEPARRKLLLANGMPSDLVNLFIAKRTGIASKMDTGVLTKEEGNIQSAELTKEITETARERRLADFQVYQTLNPPPLQFAPRQTSCTRFGNTVNCNSY